MPRFRDLPNLSWDDLKDWHQSEEDCITLGFIEDEIKARRLGDGDEALTAEAYWAECEALQSLAEQEAAVEDGWGRSEAEARYHDLYGDE